MIKQMITVIASLWILVLLIDEIGLAFSEFDIEIGFFKWIRYIMGIKFIQYFLYISNLVLIIFATHSLLDYFEDLAEDNLSEPLIVVLLRSTPRWTRTTGQWLKSSLYYAEYQALTGVWHSNMKWVLEQFLVHGIF